MEKLVLPPAIAVLPANESIRHGLELSEGTPTTTALFREDPQLGIALGAMLAHSPSSDLRRIISAGCSIGAESYTVLGLLHKRRAEGRTALMGIDINPLAVDAAQDGRYVIERSLAYQNHVYAKQGYNFEAALTEHGFVLDQTMIDELPFPMVMPTQLTRNSLVRFQRGDLREGLPTEKKVDLILCDNVLGYFSAEHATSIVDDFAAHLDEGGVLSLGASTQFLNMGTTGVEYSAWCGDITDRLALGGFTRIESDCPTYVGFRRQ